MNGIDIDESPCPAVSADNFRKTPSRTRNNRPPTSHRLENTQPECLNRTSVNQTETRVVCANQLITGKPPWSYWIWTLDPSIRPINPWPLLTLCCALLAAGSLMLRRVLRGDPGAPRSP